MAEEPSKENPSPETAQAEAENAPAQTEATTQAAADDPSEEDAAPDEDASTGDTSEEDAADAEETGDAEVSSDAEAETEASSDDADDADADDADADDADADDADADDADAEAETSDEAADDEAKAEADAEAADADTSSSNGQAQQQEQAPEHRSTIEDLLKAGAHFGHLTSRWHPRMENYIFMERNNIHILDLMQTQVMLDKAADAARRFGARGKDVLFIGTKKQAQDIVRNHAERTGQPHMVERWLGGTMTNFQTIRRSLRRMEEIEKRDKDGTLDKLKKKEKLVRLREHEKLEATLGGIRDLARLPGAVYVVDIRRENIAVREANKLGIPVIAMVDTNCDPGRVDYPIPSNDDALSSIELVTSIIADAIEEGRSERQAKEQAEQQG